MCYVFLHMIKVIESRFATRMRLGTAIAPRLRRYAAAVWRKRVPLRTCFGFVDGTAWRVCRPTYHQRELYSGHKRYHCLKFQGVVLPDGIIADLAGPYHGRQNDQYMLNESRLEDRLSDPVFDNYVVYGDQGYTYRAHVARPFRAAQLSPLRRAFNERMATVRVSVEWGFARVKQLFAFLSFVPSLRVYNSPVGKVYRVAVLLSNMITCLEGKSEASEYFHCSPPSLDEYMAQFLAAESDSA